MKNTINAILLIIWVTIILVMTIGVNSRPVQYDDFESTECDCTIEDDTPSQTNEAELESSTEHREIIYDPGYTVDDLFCMAAAIYNEAGSDCCSDDTRRLVGYVILNRVNDSRYPNTIRGVLEAKGQYGTFYYTGVKFADRYSLPEERDAVNRAWDIAQEVLEAEYIPIPETVVFQAEFKQGTSVYKHQDGMYFCNS